MSMKHQIFFVILILMSIIAEKDCLATPSDNLFQNTWRNDYGDVTITNCNEMKCSIKIDTSIDAFSCDLDGELTVLSKSAAVFQMENPDTTSVGEKKYFPINLSLSKQTLTVSVPEESHETSRGYCGMRAFFEGEYTSSSMPRVYKTSFNCEKVTTKIEDAICHSEELAYADSVLSKLYQRSPNLVGLYKY